MFSPYYAWARRRDPRADPHAHCALNVALYGEGSHHWAMTERGARDLERHADTLRIGPSALRWRQGRLSIDVNELTAPWPARLRGTITLAPQACTALEFALDAAGRHRWSPIAPSARIEVAFEQPSLRWSGTAYLDSNRGAVALEEDFVRWDWSRAALPGGRTLVLYDMLRRGAQAAADPHALALRFDARGTVERVEVPAPVALPRSAWRIERQTRCDAGARARLLRTFEDGPFYARSLVESTVLGERVQAVHESLSLTRFTAPWVQVMLPFRMPRRAR